MRVKKIGQRMITQLPARIATAVDGKYWQSSEDYLLVGYIEHARRKLIRRIIANKETGQLLLEVRRITKFVPLNWDSVVENNEWDIDCWPDLYKLRERIYGIKPLILPGKTTAPVMVTHYGKP